ncbi:MAG: trimeric intracellular cation channel family protein [Beijerinckiaceae bacterium]
MLHTLTLILDYAGVAVFAVSGALAASRKQMDMIGFVFLAVVTGIGGGTIRDVTLGLYPVFWVKEPVYLLICIASAVAVFFTAHIVWSRLRVLIWLDAVGLALFCVMGAERAALHGPVVAAAMGVITGVAGGIIRDVLAHEESIILRREIYATAALLGAAVFLGASLLLPRDFAFLLGFAAAFALRALALVRGWSLPPFRARAGRRPDEVGL